MADETPLEQRVAAIEAAIADLQRRLAETPNGRPWYRRIAGSFKDEPEFEKVLEFGREFRYADRPPEDKRA